MITCTRYVPLNKGTLEGFADIFIDKWGIEIYGITLHNKDGAKWVGIPCKEVINNGEKKYYQFFRFRQKEHFNSFSKAVFEAVDKKIKEDKEIL